jgi:hypothetical protein
MNEFASDEESNDEELNDTDGGVVNGDEGLDAATGNVGDGDDGYEVDAEDNGGYRRIRRTMGPTDGHPAVPFFLNVSAVPANHRMMAATMAMDMLDMTH